ncbi:MAG: GTP-binding protein [Eubacteriales bacterium]|nr:GTP-binding protein [Eubacteriales bacterium]
MTELYIVSGFLGAGKTTLIRQMSQRCFSGYRVVVLENDFGKAAVDAEILQQEQIVIADMSEGCICCSLNTDFVRKLRQIREAYEPEVIIVEPSGISKASEVIKGCLKAEEQGAFQFGKVITVVDVRTFRKYRENYGEFFEDQIAYADLVLLSHQEEAGKAITEVSAEIRGINPSGKLITDRWNEILPFELTSVPRNGRTAELMLAVERERKPERVRMQSGHSRRGIKTNIIDHLFGRKQIRAVTLTWEKPLDKKSLERKLKAVFTYCGNDILRAKGIVPAADGKDGILFQCISESLRLERTAAAGNELCFIGVGLDEKEIKKIFGEG